jgi:uncharacterized protein (TIGR02145 family)
MKTNYCSIIFLLSLFFTTNYIIAQNQLRVNVFASSVLGEHNLSWFMDQRNNSGSQITVQVSDMQNGQFIDNCIIQAEAYSPSNQELLVKIPASAFSEVQPGLYVLKSIDGMLKAIFNKGGAVSIKFSITKVGFLPYQTTYQFINADYLTGFHSPSLDIWIETPGYLIKDPNDPSVSCETKSGTYYSAWIKMKHKNQMIDLLIPVKKSDHTIPSDWNFYSQIAEALVVADQYSSFSADQAIALKEDVKKLQEQLKLVYVSGKSIDLLLPLLNTLIKGAATGGASVYYDTKKMVAKEMANFFLSQQINPKTHTERYFLAVILDNLNKVQDSIDYILPILTKMNHLSYKPNSSDLINLYNKWKYAIITTAISIDLAENQFVNKNLSKKLLETQLEYILSSNMPESMKLTQFARYLQINEHALISSMKKSEQLQLSFFNTFEKNWSSDGPAKSAFNTLAGKSVKFDTHSNLPEISNFTCNSQNGFNKLNWQLITSSESNKFVIKYSSLPITENNWSQAYYLMMPSEIKGSGIHYSFTPSEKQENKNDYFFGIRYIDEMGRTSHLKTTRCSQRVKDSSSQKKLLAMSEEDISKPEPDYHNKINTKDDLKNGNTVFKRESTEKADQNQIENHASVSQQIESVPPSLEDPESSKNQPVYHNNSSIITDPRDGKTYKTVKIGNQVWLAENLRFKTDDSWVFIENQEMVGESNGRFYTWCDAVKPADKSSHDICPPGWYIPSDADWKKLEITLGMSQREADGIRARGNEEGKQMKSTYGYGRYYGDNGTNASGFNALLVGYFPDDQTYFSFGRAEKWWSSSEYSASEAWGRTLFSNDNRVYRDHYLKTSGFSVRCVYDFEGNEYSEEENYQEFEGKDPEEILEEFRSYNHWNFDYKTVYYKQLQYYDNESVSILNNYHQVLANELNKSVDELLDYTDTLLKSMSVPTINDLFNPTSYLNNNCGISDYQKGVQDLGKEYFINESFSIDFKSYLKCFYQNIGEDRFSDDDIDQMAFILGSTLPSEFYEQGRLKLTTKFIKTSSGWKISLTDFQRSLYGVYDSGGYDYSEEENYQEFEEEDAKDEDLKKLIVELSINNAEISESVDSDLNDCFAALKIKMNYTAKLYENSKFVEYPKGLKIPYIVYLRPIDQSSFETFFNGEAILQNGVPNSDFRFTIGEPNFSIPDNNYEILIKFNSPYKNSSIGSLSRNDYPFLNEVCFESENANSAKKDDNHENSNKEEKSPVISENEKNFQDALKSMAEKDFKLALSKFKKVYNANSKSALKKTALISMAECSYQLKKFDETADYLDQFKNKGYLDKENNKTYNALLALSYYRKKKPDYMQGLTHAGSYEINQYPEIYQKDLLYFRAYALDKLKKTELAIEAYEKYSKAYPEERTPKFTKNLEELKYKLIIDNGEHYDYGQAYKRIDFTDKSNQKKILIYEIKNNLFLIKDNNVNGVIMPILLKNAAVGDNFIIDIEPLPIYSPISVSYLSLEADIPRSKLHIKDFAINLSYNLLKQKDYSDFIYYNHDQSSLYGGVNPEKNKLERNNTGSVFQIGSNSFSNYYLRLHVGVESLGRSLKKLNEFGSKKEVLLQI